MHSPPVLNTQAEFPVTLPPTSSNENNAETIDANPAAQEPPSKKQKLELYAPRRGTWGNLQVMPNELSVKENLEREIQDINEEDNEFEKLGKVSVVATKILFQCEQTLDLIDLIGTLGHKVDELCLSQDSVSFVVGLLLKLVKKIPDEIKIEWARGGGVLMSCLMNFLRLEDSLGFPGEVDSPEYFRLSFDSLDRVIGMVETMPQDYKTSRASIAINVINEFEKFSWSKGNLHRFTRMAEMFADEEIDDKVKEDGFLALLGSVDGFVVCPDDYPNDFYQESLQSLDLVRSSFSRIIETMNDKNVIQRLEKAQEETFGKIE